MEMVMVMLGLGASARKLRDLIGSAGSAGQRATVSSEVTALITQAIYDREIKGKATTFRQLHRIVELSQPDALKIVHQLSEQNVLIIEHNVHDALESKVSLTLATKDRLERILKPERP